MNDFWEIRRNNGTHGSWYMPLAKSKCSSLSKVSQFPAGETIEFNGKNYFAKVERHDCRLPSTQRALVQYDGVLMPLATPRFCQKQLAHAER